MSLAVEIVILLGVVLLVLATVMMLLVVTRRLANEEEKSEFERQKNLLFSALASGHIPEDFRLSAGLYLGVAQVARPQGELRGEMEGALSRLRLELKYVRWLRSARAVRRKEASVYLGVIGTETARTALEEALLREKNSSVKLYLANALADIKHEKSLPVLIQSLFNASRWYRSRVNMLISSFGKAFEEYSLFIAGSKRMEIKELMVDFASVYPSEKTRDYLVQLIDTRHKYLTELVGLTENRACVTCRHASSGVNQETCVCRYLGEVHPLYTCSRYNLVPPLINVEEAYNQLVSRAASVLSEYFPALLDDERYLESDSQAVREAAIAALARFNRPENFKRLLGYLGDDGVSRAVVNGLSLMVEREPRFLNLLVKAFDETQDTVVKSRIADVLSIRMQYLIASLATSRKEKVARVIKEVVLLGRTGEVIEFLQKNSNLDLENELVRVIRDAAEAPNRSDRSWL